MSTNVMRRVLQIGCVITLAVYFVSAFTRSSDPDEFQMLILGAEMFRGRALYTDLWDNHGPALSWILESLNHVFPWKSMSVFYIHRAVMLLVTLLSIWVGWRAICSLYRSKNQRLFGLLFLLAWPAVFLKCIEIRADGYLHLIWAIVLFGMVLKRDSKNPLWYLLWGFILGLGFLFSIKTLFVGMAFGLVLLGQCRVSRQNPLLKIICGMIGSGISVSMMVVILKAQGIFEGFIELNFGKNFDRERPEFFEGLDAIKDLSFPWVLVLGFGMIFGFSLMKRHRSMRQVLPYLSAGLLLVLVFAFALPTKYYQSLVFPALPFALAFPKIFSSFCAWIRKKYHQQSKMRWVIIIPAGMLLLGVYKTEKLDFGKLSGELEYFQAIQEQIPEDGKVFSGYGAPPSLSHPAEITSWVAIFRDQVERGEISIPSILVENEIEYIVFDRRMARMEQIRGFLQSNYIPLQTFSTLVAGQAIPVGNTQQVIINLSGVYYFEAEYNVTIDGRVVESPIKLERGPYELLVESETKRSMRLAMNPAAFEYSPEADLNNYYLQFDDDRPENIHVAWPWVSEGR